LVEPGSNFHLIYTWFTPDLHLVYTWFTPAHIVITAREQFLHRRDRAAALLRPLAKMGINQA
jgi:hypothetical protein